MYTFSAIIPLNKFLYTPLFLASFNIPSEKSVPSIALKPYLAAATAVNPVPHATSRITASLFGRYFASSSPE